MGIASTFRMQQMKQLTRPAMVLKFIESKEAILECYARATRGKIETKKYLFAKQGRTEADTHHGRLVDFRDFRQGAPACSRLYLQNDGSVAGNLLRDFYVRDLIFIP